MIATCLFMANLKLKAKHSVKNSNKYYKLQSYPRILTLRASL